MRKSADAGRRGPLKDAVLIAGPTASGKSALAMEVAGSEGGIVVNADSMQVYSVLSTVTARPRADDMKRVAHRLYGHVSPDVAYSTASWLKDVEELAASGVFADRKPVFVGGTGLYFRALTEGLSPMPPIPAEIRERWRRRASSDGPGGLHRELALRDEKSAAAIEPADGQRIVRALEVLEASGRSIRDWQAHRSPPLVDAASARMAILVPERDLLVERIERRFETMVEEGAVAEVEALLALGLPPSMPAMKAIGVPELAAVLAGDIDLATAIERAKAATRRYAKRQVTWMRHQMGEGWRRMPVTAGDTAASLYSRLDATDA